MCYNLFTCFLAHEYLGSFPFGAIVNNAVVNMPFVEHLRCRWVYLGTIALWLRVHTCVAEVHVASLPDDMHISGTCINI